MCIRDRSLPIHDRIENTIINQNSAVSYTHLDVYKRQPTRLSVQVNILRSECVRRKNISVSKVHQNKKQNHRGFVGLSLCTTFGKNSGIKALEN